MTMRGRSLEIEEGLSRADTGPSGGDGDGLTGYALARWTRHGGGHGPPSLQGLRHSVRSRIRHVQHGVRGTARGDDQFPKELHLPLLRARRVPVDRVSAELPTAVAVPADRRRRVVVVGGTFDRLHAGHERLLRAAARRGGEVRIGLTTESFLRAHPKPGAEHLQPWSTRRARLLDWWKKNAPSIPLRIRPLDSVTGGTLRREVTDLVASAERRDGVAEVQRARRRRGLPPVHVTWVPIVYARDGRPISSRRIRAGEIDPDGRRRAPIRVLLLDRSAEVRRAARALAREYFRPAIVRFVRRPVRRAGAVPRSTSGPTISLQRVTRPTGPQIIWRFRIDSGDFPARSWTMKGSRQSRPAPRTAARRSRHSFGRADLRELK